MGLGGRVAEQLTETHLLGAIWAPEDIRASSGAPIKRATGSYRWAKGFADMVMAALFIVLTSPLMAVIAAAIWLDSPGPVVFRQQRIGLRGRPFTIFKFRTMSANAPTYSYKVAIGDGRITNAGRWLRRSGLDELPQLFNVIRGEMSLIGPRPEQPFIVEQLQPWQHVRHSVKPGITGWWQIHHRDDVPLHLNLEYDMYYLEHRSVKLDCQIIWRTVKIMILGAVAVRKGQLPTEPS